MTKHTAILVTLKVNGMVYFKECTDEAAARAQADEWLTHAKKKFPHGVFTPVYYRAEALAAE